jgi:adenylate cyclase
MHLRERQEADRIAKSILPERVWNDLVGSEKSESIFPLDRLLRGNFLYEFTNLTIVYCDVEGFTALAAKIAASELVSLLDTIFSEFDELMTMYGLEKIKTIGDCYLFCAGKSKFL